MAAPSVFEIPPYGEGSGAYVDAITQGLSVWQAYDPESPDCPQEWHILAEIKALVDQWYDWDINQARESE